MRCYPYRCTDDDCGQHWDVYKNLSEIDRPEACPQCGKPEAVRYIARTHFFGAAVRDAEWNPGLGMVIKSDRHLKDEAKARGLEPVGSEPVESIHRHFDRARADREKARWDDDRIKLYD